MASVGGQHLFACTNCHSRHPFDALSKGALLCKDCEAKKKGSSSSVPVIKCSYCRSEFTKPEGTSKRQTKCERCSKSEEKHGKPTNCQYCKLPAAFAPSTRCIRCLHYEKRHGAPIACDQCRLKSAFKRGDDCKAKVDGKTLCWLCTIAYKKARKRLHTGEKARSSSGSKPERSASPAVVSAVSSGSSMKEDVLGIRSSLLTHSASYNNLLDAKRPKTDSPFGNGVSSRSLSLYGGGGDQMLEVSQLKDQIDQLKRQLSSKDKEMLEKDKKIAELKAIQMEMEKTQRDKVTRLQTQHEETITSLQVKLKEQQKQLARSNSQRRTAVRQLQEASVKQSMEQAAESPKPAPKLEDEGSDSPKPTPKQEESGTDSPSAN